MANPEDWPKRREEIIKKWEGVIGKWPVSIKPPAVTVTYKKVEKTYTRYEVEVEVEKDIRVKTNVLVPNEYGPFPAVMVVYYDAETPIREKVIDKSRIPNREIPNVRGFALDLVNRGYVTMSVGFDPKQLKGIETADGKILQPLHWLGFITERCRRYLATLPEVNQDKIAIMGHSYGGKWAMFASCFNERFACAVWCDPGIVFNEKDPNANYWEPWYLGYEKDKTRTSGIVTEANPRTGAYKELIAQGMDLNEIMALMAPRPFLVSGGQQDPIEHWKALNTVIPVYSLLEKYDKVALTQRFFHPPTKESNEEAYTFLDYILK